MGKVLKKYFIAIVPEGEIQDAVTGLKYQLKEEFGLKYALKSPAHITVKMPFLYNENKEAKLMHLLDIFFREEEPLKIGLNGFENFRERVIYIRVKYPPALIQMQRRLAAFCKEKINLSIELSDHNYKPHMTVAFQDLKKSRFSEYMEYLNTNIFKYEFMVHKMAILKKNDYKWEVYKTFSLKKSAENRKV